MKEEFMRLTMLTIALAAASLLRAQEKAPAGPPPEMVSAVIPVKTLSGDAFERLCKLLDAFKVSFRADDRLRKILVYGPKGVVEQMKRVVQELDRSHGRRELGTGGFARESCRLLGRLAFLNPHRQHVPQFYMLVLGGRAELPRHHLEFGREWRRRFSRRLYRTS